jgi:hypothetical protein
MNMNNRRVFGFLAALLLGLCAWPTMAAAARTVALLPSSGDNVDPNILRASRELLKDHLQRTRAYNVVDIPGEPTRDDPDPVQAAKQGKALGAEQVILLRLIHFGSSSRARLTVYTAESGQVLYWDSIVISGGPEELDMVIQRLVHAMQVGKPVRDAAEIDTVTAKETQSLRRRHANQSFGLRLFTLMPFNTPTDSFTAVPGGGVYFMYDARSWLADLSVDLGIHDGHGAFIASIGGYYPLLREDFTPYFGGAIRWAYMNLGGRGSSGIMLQPTVGVLLGRLSSTQLRGEIGYFINTFGEREKVENPAGYPEYIDGSKHYSHGIMISVGLGLPN